jgi:maltose O-acetyltransferase
MKLIKNLLAKIYHISEREYYKSRYSQYRLRYNVHKTFRFNGSSILIYGSGEFYAGANSYIGSYSTIQLEKDTAVSVGENCRISHNVRLYTSSALPDQDFNDYNNLRKKSGNIEIGNAVWVGVNVFIGPGVRIGNNAIIGANSVVTRDVPERAIVGGVPAQILRYKENDS